MCYFQGRVSLSYLWLSYLWGSRVAGMMWQVGKGGHCNPTSTAYVTTTDKFHERFHNANDGLRGRDTTWGDLAHSRSPQVSSWSFLSFSPFVFNGLVFSPILKYSRILKVVISFVRIEKWFRTGNWIHDPYIFIGSPCLMPETGSRSGLPPGTD